MKEWHSTLSSPPYGRQIITSSHRITQSCDCVMYVCCTHTHTHTHKHRSDVLTPINTTFQSIPSPTTHSVGVLVYVPGDNLVSPLLSPWLALTIVRAICCCASWLLLVWVRHHDRLQGRFVWHHLCAGDYTLLCQYRVSLWMFVFLHAAMLL